MWTWPQVQGDLCGLPGCPVQNVPEAHSVFKPRIENKVQLLPQACLLYRGALVNIITANNTVPSHFFFCACPVVCSLRPGVHNCRLVKRNEGCIYLYTWLCPEKFLWSWVLLVLQFKFHFVPGPFSLIFGDILSHKSCSLPCTTFLTPSICQVSISSAIKNYSELNSQFVQGYWNLVHFSHFSHFTLVMLESL